VLELRVGALNLERVQGWEERWLGISREETRLESRNLKHSIR
jgi:hypothetical protein